MQRRRVLQIALYACAFLVLVVFFQKNVAVYSAHLTDIRNAAGTPLSGNAPVPDFTAQNMDGQAFTQDDLPADAIFILVDLGCPVAAAMLEDLNAAGAYMDTENLYAVFVDIGKGDTVARFAEKVALYPNIHVLRDVEHTVKWSFKPDAFPVIYRIHDGQTVFKQVGYMRDGEA